MSFLIQPEHIIVLLLLAQQQQRDMSRIMLGNTTYTAHGPIVGPEPHVIAVCGSNGANACPSEDRWVVSALCLFNHLLEGVRKSRIWLTCLNLGALVHEHGENPLGIPSEVAESCLVQQIGLTTFSLVAGET